MRHEIMAIIGAYSRMGHSATYTMGCFVVSEYGIRTLRQARKDTGIYIGALAA